MAREGLKKHQTTATTAIIENFKIEVLGMLTLMDAEGLVCACGVLDLIVSDQKKGNLKFLLKYIFRCRG